MNARVARTRTLVLSLRAYVATLVICSALYFIRPEGISIYIFDVVWIIGLLAFPQQFLRMPKLNYLSLVIFAAAIITSTLYCEIDGRPLDPTQATIVFIRFTQMAICANFFFNCVSSGYLEARDFVMPTLLALLIPLWGGLALHAVAPGQTLVFNRYAGYLGNPNSLSLYVVVSTSVFFSLLRFKLLPTFVSYALALAYILAAASSLMLSGSNSGILLFAIVTTLSITRSLRGGILLIFSVAFLYIFMESLQDVLILWARDLANNELAGLRRTGALIIVLSQGLDLNELGSYAYRDEIKEYLFIQQFQDLYRILLGLGPGQSKNLVKILDGNSVTIHNFYLGLFLELGVLGTVSFAALTLLFFRRFCWSLDTILMSSGFLLASTGTPVLYLPYFWVPLFSAIAGLTVASMERRKNTQLAGSVLK